jgi:hypothetical protein
MRTDVCWSLVPDGTVSVYQKFSPRIRGRHGIRRAAREHQRIALPGLLQGHRRPLQVRGHLRHRGTGAGDRPRGRERAAELVGGPAGGLDPVVGATRTIEEYAPIFLRHHRVEGNTKDTYDDTLRLHVIPFIGRSRVAEMNRLAARSFFTALEDAGRSPNVIRQAKVVLAAMFTMAVADAYLDANPFHDVKTPKVGGPRAIKIVTTDQYVKVRDCLPTKPARVLYPPRGPPDRSRRPASCSPRAGSAR